MTKQTKAASAAVASVKLLRVAGDHGKGWDAADAELEGVVPSATNCSLEPYEPPPDPGGDRYVLKDDGVWTNPEEGSPEWICAPLLIVAHTRDDRSDDWGIFLKWRDLDEVTHRWAVPMSMFSGSADAILAELLKRGLRMTPHRRLRNHILCYVQTANVVKKMTCVDKTGWHGSTYVSDRGTIGENADEYVFQGNFSGPGCEKSGTIEQWRNKVARLCTGNSRLVLSIATAFAALILYFIRGESGGFHLRGPSSIGKSTTLFLAASVFGGESFCKSWNGTLNGIEGTAAAHNDLLLPLDELAQINPRSAGQAALTLPRFSGQFVYAAAFMVAASSNSNGLTYPMNECRRRVL